MQSDELTVREYNDILEEMRSIYPFVDSETRIYTYNPISRISDQVNIITVDKKTGIVIHMYKQKKPLE